MTEIARKPETNNTKYISGKVGLGSPAEKKTDQYNLNMVKHTNF